MDPKQSSSASTSLAPSASTYPPPYDASPSTSQEYLSALGFPYGEDHTKAVEAVLSRHPEIMQCLLHYKTASLTGDSSTHRLQIDAKKKKNRKTRKSSPTTLL
jgi:hypothetical protein